MPCLALWLTGSALGAAQDGGLPLREIADRLHMDPGASFLPGPVDLDAAGAHHRLWQTLGGLRVLGGQATVHLDGAGRVLEIDDFTLPTGRPVLDPVVQVPEALALVERDRRQRAESIAAELVLARPDPGLVPLAGGLELRVAGAGAPGPLRLAYEVKARWADTETVALVDALTGRLLARRVSRETAAPATVQAIGFHAGPVALGAATRSDGTLELRDFTRGRRDHPRFPALGAGNRVLNGHFQGNLGAPDPASEAATAASGAVWGDGSLYLDAGRSDDSATAPAVAVTADVARGMAAAWDFLGQVLGRDGLDGLGSSVYARTHALHGFANAFWDDACFCVTFGDGDYVGPQGSGTLAALTTLDIVGHEMSHGLMAATSALYYWSESGGLNEANSDILGKMMEFHARRDPGAPSDRVPPPCPDCTWDLGRVRVAVENGRTAPPAHWTALRSMDRPSSDGRSADFWMPTLAYAEVHTSSGPMNRAFRYLAQGAPSDPGDPAWSPFLPGGMGGLGTDAATRLWYRVLTSGRLPLGATYAQARQAALQAAGAGEVAAVQDAFSAINVGLPSGSPDIVCLEADPQRTGSVGGVLQPGGVLDFQVASGPAQWTLEEPADPGLTLTTWGDVTTLHASSQAAPGFHALTCRTLQGAARLLTLVLQPDLDGDGVRDAWDLGVLAPHVGGPAGGADLNGDGQVNMLDILLLILF